MQNLCSVLVVYTDCKELLLGFTYDSRHNSVLILGLPCCGAHLCDVYFELNINNWMVQQLYLSKIMDITMFESTSSGSVCLFLKECKSFFSGQGR